jgi:hypothetical protein
MNPPMAAAHGLAVKYLMRRYIDRPHSQKDARITQFEAKIGFFVTA